MSTIDDGKSEIEKYQTPAGRASQVALEANLIGRTDRRRKQFVLCFDGTGNRFSGTDSDSNILKIYRMLDRNDGSQLHYYQPGIGTYVQSNSLNHTSRAARLRSWYLKAKDQAVGTSFADHVMGGYKFLMRYYAPGDDIYFFGFSRGAYTARFLAEMLDHVGLLSQGNEEMAQFAWKTFQKWQIRQERTEKEKAQKKYLLDFMCAFRETFSRPVRRIRFLGLFDTVNSVPAFETRFMERSKFPYTAHTTAKVIRHAVSIDERRSKFRQDLISEVKPKSDYRYRCRVQNLNILQEEKKIKDDKLAVKDRGRQESKISRAPASKGPLNVPEGNWESFRDGSETYGIKSLSPNFGPVKGDSTSFISSASHESLLAIHRHDPYNDDESDGEDQDIQEIWFAGGHGDIGGGWPLEKDEEVALSHIPLVWVLREATKAGLSFDPTKLRALNCYPDDEDNMERLQPRRQPADDIPDIEVDPATPTDLATEPFDARDAEAQGGKIPMHMQQPNTAEEVAQEAPDESVFRRMLHLAATTSRVHDVLGFNSGEPATSVMSWWILELLPFRRLDLRKNGSWKPIRWPLPKGDQYRSPEEENR